MLVVQDVGAAGFEVTTSVSEAELPVSVVPINRLPVVLLYVPSVEAVTLTLIVQVLRPLTVIFENEREVAPTVSEDGNGGAAPQPL